MFRRKSADAAPPTAEVDVPEQQAISVANARTRAYTPSKKELGKSTPKRTTPGRRVVEPAPANRREAFRRARAKQRDARAEARAGMMAGKEEYLLPRDKGADRALVRDIVDSRRNVATYFLPGAFIVIIGSAQSMPAVVRASANVLWGLLAVAVIIDSLILARRVKRDVRSQFPDSKRRHSWYAIMRSASFRKMRMPAPQVKVGEKLPR